MKLKNKLIFLIIVIFFTFVSCSNKVLEFNFATLDIKEKIIDNKKYIEVNGRCNHSALNIKKIEILKKDSIISCLVYLTLSDGLGNGGNFTQNIKITPNIKNIYFGNKQHLILQK